MIKIGDRVKQKYTIAKRYGTVIGVFEEDKYITNNKGEKILFAVKGEIKVNFDIDLSKSTSQIFSKKELEKI